MKRFAQNPIQSQESAFCLSSAAFFCCILHFTPLSLEGHSDQGFFSEILSFGLFFPEILSKILWQNSVLLEYGGWVLVLSFPILVTYSLPFIPTIHFVSDLRKKVLGSLSLSCGIGLFSYL